MNAMCMTLVSVDSLVAFSPVESPAEGGVLIDPESGTDLIDPESGEVLINPGT
jgi:hypothetical protein